MSRIAYINGQFVSQRNAITSMEDRGYQFADGVYEVIALYDQRLIDAGAHMSRLERSLEALTISMPMSMSSLRFIIRELLRRNKRQNGLIYIQVTRGIATRNHLAAPQHPILSMSVNPVHYPDTETQQQGVNVITVPDERWARCDIKSIALLPNVLARKKASERHARESWQIKDGVITEGALSNAYIVKNRTIITHPLTQNILGGITRDVVLELAVNHGIAIDERPFDRDEALAADEAFLTSASSFVLPVTVIDDQPVGNGSPGPVTQKLMKAYTEHIQQQPRSL